MWSIRFIIQLMLITLIPAAVLFILCYLCLAVAGVVWTPWTCIVEQRKIVKNLHRIDFEITETNCDLLAKDDMMRVLVSRAGDQHKISILEFDPLNWAPLPDFSVSDNGEITVRVEFVGEIVHQESEWNGRPIHYQIGRIEYANPQKQELNDLHCRRVRRPDFAPSSPPNPKLDPWLEWSLECRGPEVR